MSTDPPCAHCPHVRAGRPGFCLARRTGYRQLCVFTDPASPEYRADAVRAVRGRDRTTARAAAPAAAAPDPDAVAGHRERQLLILSCDYRSDALHECGCKARRHCGLGRGAFPREPWAVTYSDCLNCVSSADPRTPG